ncbi:MAG: hypothetical protein AB7S26_21735 [Sandaracinaceae bacterium]
MNRAVIFSFVVVVVMLAGAIGCDGDGGSDAGGSDAGRRDAGSMDAGGADAGRRDAGRIDAGGSDAGATDGGATDAGSADAGPSCLDEGHAAGDRYPAGDHCNWCDCGTDGVATCTARTCGSDTPGCDYDGVTHGYGERFNSTDGCNECVCAASGLACTHRCPALPQEGAILLETLDEQCGDDPTFTGRAVIEGLPLDHFTAPFPYERTGPLYPETLPDTNVRVRIAYDGGFIACRIPSPTQPAIDMEVEIDLVTEDGAFDEGFHTYLRRNNFGFLDAWTSVASAPRGGLDGTYAPMCLDDNGFTFAFQVNADGTASGDVSKLCETDILLTVGAYAYP